MLAPAPSAAFPAGIMTQDLRKEGGDIFSWPNAGLGFTFSIPECTGAVRPLGQAACGSRPPFLPEDGSCGESVYFSVMVFLCESA